MDDKTYYGSLAEAKVILEYTKLGYHIFNQITGKAPFDIVIYKDGDLKKVSIKSCNKLPNSVGSYSVEVGRVRSNKTENKIYKFNKEECDILAIYLVKEDRLVFINSEDAHDKKQLTVK